MNSYISNFCSSYLSNLSLKLHKINNNKLIFYILFYFSIFTIVYSLIIDSPLQIIEGMYNILTSPSVLLTDYIFVGGLGATLFNAGFLFLLNLLALEKYKTVYSSNIIAALFMLFGFSFFGKNIFNTLPISFGVWLYSRIIKESFYSHIYTALLSTALSPIVSHITFFGGFSFNRFLIGYLAGIIAGFIISPLAKSFLNFHRGYSLYNTGFTAGIIAMIAQGILKLVGMPARFFSLLSRDYQSYIIGYLLFIFIIFMIIALCYQPNCLKYYKNLLSYDGRAGSDFIDIHGLAPSLINMSFMGFLAIFIVLISSIEFNGPILGGIFAMFGFASFGKHPKNVFFIISGAGLATIFFNYINNGINISVSLVIAILFSTSLAPLAGHYGSIAGIIAGFCHILLVSLVGDLHHGLNLYNNGLASCFVAAILYPLFDSYHSYQVERKLQNKQPKNIESYYFENTNEKDKTSLLADNLYDLGAKFNNTFDNDLLDDIENID